MTVTQSQLLEHSKGVTIVTEGPGKYKLTFSSQRELCTQLSKWLFPVGEYALYFLKSAFLQLNLSPMLA